MKKGHRFIILTGILSGTIVFGGAVFAKMGLSLFQIAVFRAAFSLLLLFYLLYKKDLGLSKKLLMIFVVFGFIEAMSLLTEFAPVVLGVPVSITVLLLYTAPLWTVILSRSIFKEKITTLKVVAIALVLLGVIFLVDPRTIEASGNLVGILLALAGGLFLSLWAVFGKICGNEKIHPVKTQFYTVLLTLLFVAIFQPIAASLIRDFSLTGFSLNLPATIWVYLAIFALVSSLIPHLAYYHGIKEVPASTAGVILLLEPLSGTILAALFLAQAIALNVLLGGILILAANYLVIKSDTAFPKGSL
jgi:drug/metabolite transporter, DME family